jgi:Carboxypeptidase regulatory-like domain
MAPRRISSVLLLPVLCCAPLHAQIAVSGRVVDDNGAGVAGARVELRATTEAPAIAASTDLAGDFRLRLPAAGDYQIRAERQGFYLFRGATRHFDESTNQLTVVLNHQQEFSEQIDVTASPPVVDPQEAAERKEVDNTEMLTVPYAAPADYRNALPLMDGVVQDNDGRFHFNGGAANQASYTLDGFNIANPVTGLLDARIDIESIQSMTVESSRISAENGRGSSGVLDLTSRMGDDHWRAGATNFIPGASTEGGLHLNKWTPRVEFSGPIAKGRAWFHNGVDAFYSNDVVHGLPNGQNHTRALTTSDLSRFQVNLTPGHILSGGFLVNLIQNTRQGLSFLTPAESTTDSRQATVMSMLRDQVYFHGGALLDLGFADDRGFLRNLPQGLQLYEITPLGNHGNYFVNLDRHFYRQQEIANLFLPTRHLWGTHLLKFGIDFEREAFHQSVERHDYEVLRDDNSVARYVTFSGSPFQRGKNFEEAQYVEDHWVLREGLSVESGLRLEWNEIVRDFEIAPRAAVAWAPGVLRGTKLSAGWGVYYDSIPLDTIVRQQDQTSFATFYPPGASPVGPVPTVFQVNQGTLRTPYYRAASFTVERKLPFDFYGKAGYFRRQGSDGFTFESAAPETPAMVYQGAVFNLANDQRVHYDAFDIAVKRTFAGQYEWFIGYTRSSARTNTAVEYSLENPIFALQMPGPLNWDTPNRVHMWGWAPLAARRLPKRFEFLLRNTSAVYLVEYRTGFPFSVVDEQGFLQGRPNSARFPDYFSLNLHFERKFRAMHYLWAWRCGFDNLTNNRNPNYVNNVTGTSQFLTYARGQSRAFSVRLRFLGRK